MKKKHLLLRFLLCIHLNLENRLFEWVSAIALVGNGVFLVLWPTAIEHSLFRYMEIIFSSEILTVLYLLAGLMRVGALLSNEPIWGPRFRLISSGLGAMLWGQMMASLIPASLEINTTPSLSIVTYSALMLGELYSAFRASRANAHRYF